MIIVLLLQTNSRTGTALNWVLLKLTELYIVHSYEWNLYAGLGIPVWENFHLL